MRLEFQSKPNWPPLAWVARIRRRSNQVEVLHGVQVERADAWFCEATWDGDFAAGDFDRTDIVSGSGGRCRDDKIVFVSSGSTVDRLQWLERDDEVLISNTLPGLLRVASEELDPTYPHYMHDLFSVVKGLGRYVSSLPATNGPVQLCYFDNIEWDGTTCRRVAKPFADRRFHDFDGFHEFLRASIHAIADNMRDSQRAHRYEFIGSLSTGYDSTTITALASEAGLREVICFMREEQRDRGNELAHYFGVEPIEVDINAWRQEPLGEVPFVAGDCFGEEAQYAVLRERLAGKVYLSGYHGDKIWDIANDYPGDDIRRGDPSGTALTEFRLHAGFLHCAVPFFAVRAATSILAISQAEAMRLWDVGGGYSRPICRRIVENAGLPRDAFGVVKSFASRWMIVEPDLVSEESRQELRTWIDERRPRWTAAGRRPPLVGPAFEVGLYRLANVLRMGLNSLPGTYRLGLHKLPVSGHILNLGVLMPHQPPPVFGASRYVFPWAVERVAQSYAD